MQPPSSTPAATKLTPLHLRLQSLLRECRTVHQLRRIHALLIAAGLSQDASATAQLLRLSTLSLPGDIAYASLVFHQIKTTPDPSIWNTMLRGYSLSSHHEKAVAHYAHMRREGVIPNKHTYPLLLKAISKPGKGNPDQVHAQILKFGFGSDPSVENSLVSVYANSGDLGSARKVFDGINRKDPIPWTSLVRGYVKNQQADEGLALFAEIRTEGVEVDEVLIVSVFNGIGTIGNVWLGRCIHGFYVECGRVKWDVYVGSAIIDMYAKCGYSNDARQMFEEMPFRNVVSWSSLIAGYVHCDRFKEALSIFRDMLDEGLKPNQVTLASVLTACAQLGALDQGRWVHGYIDRNKLGLNSITGTSLIDMYAKCGCINDAMAIFHGLPQKDVYPWSALINGLAMHGLAVECLNLFSQMLKESVQPNEVTFVGVLHACSHGGLVDQGRKYFDSMFKVYGVKPKLEHYGCMVDLLGRVGYLEEALCLIESMPMEPSVGVWGALFGACMIHKDFLLGERIGKYLVRMQPHHSGWYALLANMYSVSQKWEEAANIRMNMKRRSIEKTPGCSWLEVNGVLHEFIALDESHSHSGVIYETLYGMTMLMRLEGYLPNSHQLFLEMDV